MSKESFETKIYNPRDIEGEPNTRALDLVHELEEKFKANPAFVGIAPKGSQFHGYNENYSDVDVIILFDSSKIQQESDNNSFTTGYALDKDKPVHFFYRDVNLENILHSLDSDPDFVTIAILTQMVTGKEINFYRDQISSKFKELSSDNLNKIKKRVVDYLIEKESYEINKAVHRIPDLESKEKQILIKRRRLWENRFDQIWLTGK